MTYNPSAHDLLTLHNIKKHEFILSSKFFLLLMLLIFVELALHLSVVKDEVAHQNEQ